MVWTQGSGSVLGCLFAVVDMGKKYRKKVSNLVTMYFVTEIKQNLLTYSLIHSRSLISTHLLSLLRPQSSSHD